MTVTTQSFQVGSTIAWNVLATLPGLGDTGASSSWAAITTRPRRARRSRRRAEDNASGCAGVLELARIFTVWRPQVTIVFACYSGEEQGLYGGAAHAQSLVAAGLAPTVALMLNMDMIGYTADADLDVLIETNTTHAGRLADFQAAAATFTDLRVVTSFSASGSDHVPFLQRGMPAVLTIENDWSIYPHYHRTTDLPGALTPVMAENILRMAAVVAAPADAPLRAARRRLRNGDPAPGRLRCPESGPVESAHVRAACCPCERGRAAPLAGRPPRAARPDAAARRGAVARDPIEPLAAAIRRPRCGRAGDRRGRRHGVALARHGAG